MLEETKKEWSFKEIVIEMKAQMNYTELDEETCKELAAKYI